MWGSPPPQVIECLKENKRQLTQRCHQRIFKLQEEEMVDPELDYQLMKVCKTMIRVGQQMITTQLLHHMFRQGRGRRGGAGLWSCGTTCPSVVTVVPLPRSGFAPTRRERISCSV